MMVNASFLMMQALLVDDHAAALPIFPSRQGSGPAGRPFCPPPPSNQPPLRPDEPQRLLLPGSGELERVMHFAGNAVLRAKGPAQASPGQARHERRPGCRMVKRTKP